MLTGIALYSVIFGGNPRKHNGVLKYGAIYLNEENKVMLNIVHRSMKYNKWVKV